MKSSSLVHRRVAAAAAAALRAVRAGRLALGVTGVRQRDDHVFRRDQVEDVEVFLAGADFAAARVAEFFLEVAQLGADHSSSTSGFSRMRIRPAIVFEQLLVFLGELFLLQRRSGGAGAFRGSAAPGLRSAGSRRPAGRRPRQVVRTRGIGAGARRAARRTRPGSQRRASMRSRASVGLAEVLISSIISSMLASATVRPSRMWRARRAPCAVRRSCDA